MTPTAEGASRPIERHTARRRRVVASAVLAVALAACGSAAVDPADVPPLPPITAAEAGAILAASELPVVLNVWASWCVPCRSEAPLLEEAHRRFGEEIRFIGINVRDAQDGARSFIAEFGETAPHGTITHYFDGPGEVPPALGGSRGVPLTFFYAPGGDLVHLHFGVIDERTLALQIDELLVR